MRFKELINKGIAKTNRMVKFPQKLIIAKETIQELREYSDAGELVIVLLKGIGDSVYGLSYIESLKAKYKSRSIVVVGNSKLQSFIESYPCIDKFIPYDVSKGEYEKYKAFMDCERIRILDGHDYIFNTDPYQMRHGEQLTAIDIIRKQVLNLNESCFITYPNIKTVKVQAIEDFEKKCNKIVVFNPYSNSVSNVGLETYAMMAEIIKSKGYIPYTNLVKGQKGISGTEELYCSIEELAEIVKQSAGVISIRSGLLDMVINTGTPIFAIYSNCTDKFRKIYDLNAWKGKSIVTQIDYDSLNREAFKNKFAEWVDTVLNGM